MRSLLVVVATIATVTAGSDDTALKLSNEKCTNSWSVTDFSYSCNGDNGDCGFGNKLQASGTIDIGTAFDADEEVSIILKAGIFVNGVVSVTVGESSQKICDVLTPSGGTCGAADSYTFSTDIVIPDHNALQQFLRYTSVTAKVMIGDISTCSAVVSATSSSSSYSMTYVAVASSVVVGSVLVGASIYGCQRRRRIVHRESLKRALVDFEMATAPRNRAAYV